MKSGKGDLSIKEDKSDQRRDPYLNTQSPTVEGFLFFVVSRPTSTFHANSDECRLVFPLVHTLGNLTFF